MWNKIITYQSPFQLNFFVLLIVIIYLDSWEEARLPILRMICNKHLNNCVNIINKLTYSGSKNRPYIAINNIHYS